MGRLSIALVPFWRFDAKGGEVVLVGLLRDLQGCGHKHFELLICVLYAYAMYLTFLHCYDYYCKLC